MTIPKVTVVIPSYRRPARLKECLDSLAVSERQPDEVVVVLRADDLESADAVDKCVTEVQVVRVAEPGVLAAMIAGVKRATGDVIAFFDDDAVPRPDWLRRALAHLEPPNVGGAGGRDVVSDVAELPHAANAGRLSRWGKMIGNHHLVFGAPREVDVLKGANMVFKREALALPIHLLGEGAQAHYEVGTCLWAKSRGWCLILDPGAVVLHLPGERFDADRRSNPSPWATYRAAYNYTWCLLSMRPGLAARRLLFGVLIGDRAIPGLGRGSAALVRGEWRVWAALLPSLAGQLHGAIQILLGRRVEMTTFEG